MFQQNPMPVTPNNPTLDIDETLALVSLAGFAVQRAVEILDPVFAGLLHAAKKARGKDELPLAVPDATAKGWMTALAAFLLALALVGGTNASLPEVMNFRWGGWDKWLLALAISAGANGFNSMLKFAEHLKNSRKSEPPTVPTVTITPPAPKVSPGGQIKFLANVIGADDKVIAWEVLGPATSGSITADGQYTAPAVAGTYFVAAISRANRSAAASVAVTVG